MINESINMNLKTKAMTLPGNSIRSNFLNRFGYLLLTLLITTITYSQEDIKSKEWWTSITKKHNITYNTYSLYGNCFIIGEKGFEGEIETYKNVIVISKGSEEYWIFKSLTASYDPKTTTLMINDCTMDKFKIDPESITPEESYEHINYSINFEKNIATMSDVRPDSEIESAINKLFNESIVAGEQLDFDKMKMQVNDKFLSGFINSGRYYTSFNLLFDDYKKATNGIKSQRLAIDNKKITILSGNSVLLTANGQFSATTNTDQVIDGKFAWTIIYKMIENEWKIIHTHMTNER